jgi:rod shape determining protein RodA
MNRNLVKIAKTLLRSCWPLTGIIMTLLVVSVMFVYSACYIGEDGVIRPLYQRQIVWMIVGLGCYFGMAVYDYRRLRHISWAVYGIGLVLLMLVLIIGSTIYGAKRWLMLFGVIGIQPSEIAKLSTIILLAHQLSLPVRDLSRMRDLAYIGLLMAVPVGLIMLQPDLGTALVFVPTAIIMMFVGGMPFKYLATAGGIGIVLVTLILCALFLPEKLGASKTTQARIRRLTFLSEYQQGRIEVFFHPDKDPLGAGWNKRQSEIAVGSGGLRGKGYLNGTQNILGFLPRSVAPTDFIYSVIAEEKGFLGSFGVLALFFGVLFFGTLTALRTPDAMGRLLCTGIVSLIFCHVFINIAMTVGLMPITGLPLPLLSYGGTFMIIMMSALGIIQSVYIRSHHRDAYD